MQLIDSNGCVVDERFISPFRGTYNDNDLKHITLFSYLKAFRFTGSPVLYLECEIHMCQTACPPQMCYWRRLSKRSAAGNSSLQLGNQQDEHYYNSLDGFEQDQQATTTSSSTTKAPEQRRTKSARRTGRTMSTSTKKPDDDGGVKEGSLSDRVSLFQALEVRQERDSADAAAYSLDLPKNYNHLTGSALSGMNGDDSLMCYRRAELVAFLITAVSVILVALSVTIGCCWRAIRLRRRDRKKLISARAAALTASINSANNKYNHYAASKPPSSYASSMLSTSSGATRIPTPMMSSSPLNRYHQPQHQQLLSPLIYATAASATSRHKTSSNHLLMPD